MGFTLKKCYWLVKRADTYELYSQQSIGRSMLLIRQNQQNFKDISVKTNWEIEIEIRENNNVANNLDANGRLILIHRSLWVRRVRN